MPGSVGRSGGDRSKPNVRPLNAGAPQDLPKKPNGFTEAETEVWDFLLSKLPASILKPIDQIELTFLTQLIVQAGELMDRIKKNPDSAADRRLYLQTFKEVHRLSVAFGLNPVDRERVGIPDDDEPDDVMEIWLANHNQLRT